MNRFAKFNSSLRSIATLAAYLSLAPACAYPQAPAKPEPVPQRLFGELRNGDIPARRKAAMQMGVLRNRSAVRALLSALNDKEWRVREAAAFSLGQIADPAAGEGLTTATLSDKEVEVRASAAFALGMIANEKTTETLSKALEDDEAAVRSSAIIGLGLLQDEGAVDELIDLLDDASFDVRYDAAWALGQIGDADAADHLRASIVAVDQMKLDASMREAYRQTVQDALENIAAQSATAAKSANSSRPRRAGGEETSRPANRPAVVVKTAAAVPTERALQAVAKGAVGLRVLVGNSGKVERAYVIRRLGYGLDQRAVEAVLQYRFDPGYVSGLPQTSWVDIDVRF